MYTYICIYLFLLYNLRVLFYVVVVFQTAGNNFYIPYVITKKYSRFYKLFLCFCLISISKTSIGIGTRVWSILNHFPISYLYFLFFPSSRKRRCKEVLTCEYVFLKFISTGRAILQFPWAFLTNETVRPSKFIGNKDVPILYTNGSDPSTFYCLVCVYICFFFYRLSWILFFRVSKPGN